MKVAGTKPVPYRRVIGMKKVDTFSDDMVAKWKSHVGVLSKLCIAEANLHNLYL